MWLTLILKNWQLVIIALLSCALGLSTLHGRMLKAEKELAVSNLAEYRRLADQALKQEVANNERANQEITDAIPVMVEQAEKNAYANYLARFGRGNAACGIRADGVRVRPGGDHGQAGSAQGIDGPRSESLAARPGSPAPGTGPRDDVAAGPTGARVACGCESAFVESAAVDAGMLNLWQAWARKNKLPISKE